MKLKSLCGYILAMLFVLGLNSCKKDTATVKSDITSPEQAAQYAANMQTILTNIGNFYQVNSMNENMPIIGLNNNENTFLRKTDSWQGPDGEGWFWMEQKQSQTIQNIGAVNFSFLSKIRKVNEIIDFNNIISITNEKISFETKSVAQLKYDLAGNEKIYNGFFNLDSKFNGTDESGIKQSASVKIEYLFEKLNLKTGDGVYKVYLTLANNNNPKESIARYLALEMKCSYVKENTVKVEIVAYTPAGEKITKSFETHYTPCSMP